MKIEIEVPNPPEGWEIYGYGKPQPGDMVHELVGWSNAILGHPYAACYLLARKKRTLADWANEQELFKALVSIHRDRLEIRLVYNTDGYWIFDAAFMQRQRVYLGVPPGFAELQLVNGKWELA